MKASNDYHKIEHCRVCNSKKIEVLFSLGMQPLTGVFVRPDQPDPISAPLELVFCEDCWFLQLANTINPDLMYDSYWYRSGTNQTMINHLKGVVDDVTSKIPMEAGDICLDIGCNDGTLLSAYKANGLVKIGVDPSNAIDSVADLNIIKVNDYFSKKAVDAFLKGKKVKALTAISMFYDLDNPHAFIDDISSILSPDGTWVVEMNYTGDMIRNCGYDMISHEHIAYYTLTVFEKLVLGHGLYVNDVSLNPINGGSIRIFSSHRKTKTENVDRLKEREAKEGLNNKDTYVHFISRMETAKKKIRDKILDIVASGEKVFLYGASTRGNTILLYCDLDHKLIEGASERNPLKYGLVTPGTRIPIMSEAKVREINPKYLLILPYTFVDEFVERESDYLNKGGCFLVPVPELRMITKKDNKRVEELC